MSSNLKASEGGRRTVGRRVATSTARLAATLAAVLSLGACGSSGYYAWYTQLPRSEWGGAAGEYIIGAGDVLSITVYNQPEVTTKAKVRTDGRIAVTFLGEIVVAGKRPAVLSQELEARLKQFIVSPRVTVNVEESRPVTVSVLGEMQTKGTLTLEQPAGLLQALAQSGGLTEFADDSKIFVLRRVPVFRRIRFTYESIVNNESGAAMFPLRTGDVIVVE